MGFMGEFVLGMILLSPVFAFLIYLRKENDDLVRSTFKMQRDLQKARRGEYDKIDECE